jgi:hypothetical protein
MNFKAGSIAGNNRLKYLTSTLVRVSNKSSEHILRAVALRMQRGLTANLPQTRSGREDWSQLYTCTIPLLQSPRRVMIETGVAE